MVRRKILVSGILGVSLLCAAAALAQETAPEGRHEISIQGTGFFTKDSQGNGISQHSTNTGGPLISYRFHFNRWLGADAAYGYTRITQQSLTPSGAFGVQSNVHEATGALVVTLPWSVVRLKPYVLGGAGALAFDPTGNPGAFVDGAQTQTKAAFVYGGGVDYKIAPRISFRVEYRGFVYGRPDFGLSTINSGATTHTAQPSAGLVFHL